MEKINSEAWEQEAVFKWARANQIRFPELQLLHASLNGVKLSPRLAAKMKRQGMRSGIPDIFLPVSREIYHGLFIELKKEKGGVVSAIQKKIIHQLRAEGYQVNVCHGYHETIKTLEDYLYGRS